MKHQMEPDNVKLRNQWVSVNPREWSKRDDMTVMVGLGSGGKSEQMAHVMAIINLQAQAMQMPQLGLVTPTNLYNSAKKVAEIAGYKNADAFFTQPQPGQPAAPQQPDPKLQEIQMKAQLDQQKTQMDAQLQQQMAERQANNEAMQAQADIAVQQRKTEAEIALAREKFEFDKQLKLLDHQTKVEQFRMQQEAKAQQEATAAPQGPSPDIVAPIAHLVTGLGEQLAKHHAAHSAMVVEAIKAGNGPKKVIRDEAGRVIGTAPAN